MGVRYFGASILRAEDKTLLTGQGNYVDDITRPGLLHAAFVRAEHAHALILGIDATLAQAVPGVVAIITNDNLPDVLKDKRMAQPYPSPVLKQGICCHILAANEVNYVGQTVAVVIAESRHLAEDAAALIAVNYQVLDAVIDCQVAYKEGAPLAHCSAPDNIVATLKAKFGDVDVAFANAAHVVSISDHHHRGGCHAMETRGVIAEDDPSCGEITLWSATQCPYLVRRLVAQHLDIPESSLRVIAPDVGGGFGPKASVYPEEVVVCIASRMLSRPIKWIEDRREHFTATQTQRDQFWNLEAAVDKIGKVLGVRGTIIHDNGAFVPYGLLLPMTTLGPLPGPYSIRNIDVTLEAVFTNTTPNSPVRGAGRPNAAYAMERVMQAVSRSLGLDPVEVRAINLVRKDAFPYETGALNRVGKPVVYDSGDYHGCLDKAVNLADYKNFVTRQDAARKDGRYLGIGVAACVEDTGIGPYEGATVRVDSSGKVMVETGAASQGQGHKTVIKQIAADALGVTFEDVRVQTGDTGRFAQGVGAIGSRIAVTVGSSVHLAATQVGTTALALASEVLDQPQEELELSDGAVRGKGDHNVFISLGDLATRLAPMAGGSVPLSFNASLEATSYATAKGQPYANGTNIAEVEVDIGTGEVRVLRYSVAHDCGNMINPMIVDGQIVGGVVHGIGNALFEEMIYDPSGQPLTTNYSEYLLPLSSEMPEVNIVHQETPSPLNELGIKGAGEGGAIPATAAVVAAIENALEPFGVVIERYPVSPERLCALIVAGENVV
jgi:carbon-monoxide dehydrogenase large subunit